MTRVLRRPDPAHRVIHTKALHDAGACVRGCPWCRPSTPDSDRIPLVILDDEQPPRKNNATK